MYKVVEFVIIGGTGMSLIQRLLEMEDFIDLEMEKIKEELGQWFMDEYPLFQAS